MTFLANAPRVVLSFLAVALATRVAAAEELPAAPGERPSSPPAELSGAPAVATNETVITFPPALLLCPMGELTVEQRFGHLALAIVGGYGSIENALGSRSRLYDVGAQARWHWESISPKSEPLHRGGLRFKP